MTGGRTWRGWAVPLPNGGTYLDRDAAKLVLFLLRYYAAATGPRDGLGGTADGSALVREVRAACEVSTREMSDGGHVGRTSCTDQEASAPRPDDLLTMSQVAEELNVDARHARRLAGSAHLGAVTYAGRNKLVRRFEVDAYKNRSRSAR